jgi:hypothetical protein
MYIQCFSKLFCSLWIMFIIYIYLIKQNQKGCVRLSVLLLNSLKPKLYHIYNFESCLHVIPSYMLAAHSTQSQAIN